MQNERGRRRGRPVAVRPGNRAVAVERPRTGKDRDVIDHGSGDSLGAGSSDEDAELLWQATGRAEALLDDLAAGRPHADELRALLTYLRDVVLARISEEERQVFTSLRQVDAEHPDIELLHQDHLQLREDIEGLAAAAGAHGSRDPDQLSAMVRQLITRLEGHLRSEAATLANLLSGGYAAGRSGWANTEHWYLLTEGPVIDLDRLRPEQAEDAVLNRLTHLRAGERVELRCEDNPERLRYRLQRRAPGDYSWSERHDPGEWTVSVTRRQAPLD